MKVRDHECLRCRKAWTSPVRLSPHTANLSGEATEVCLECGSRSVSSSPIRETLIHSTNIQIDAMTYAQNRAMREKATMTVYCDYAAVNAWGQSPYYVRSDAEGRPGTASTICMFNERGEIIE